MPAKTETMAHPEFAGLRESRRTSDIANRGAARRPVPRVRGAGGNGGLWSARGSGCENTNPNVDMGIKGRRSPRLGACSGSSNKHAFYPHAGGGTSALADVTNVTNAAAGWSSNVEKVKPAKPPHSLQLPAPTMVVDAHAAQPGPMVVEESIGGHAEAEDVQTVQEYAPDILAQLFFEETAFCARPDYMDTQRDISAKMRTILIDWLVEVHMKYRLRPETLHLTINLIDRYLAKTSVMRKRLQLVGVVAMFIASKYEEIRPPELVDFVYITDNAYTKKDVLHMECTMLTTLSFQIMVPTAAHFFDILEKVNGCDQVHREVAQYLLELSLLDLQMLQYTPSQLVAAALLISNDLLKRSPLWPAAMVQQSRNTEQALRNCADDLRQLLEADRAGEGGQSQAVRKKFSLPQRHAVAKVKF